MLVYFLVVAGVGALVSLARILTANSQALSQLVWAEDGLFPLCITQAGYLNCLVDPFAGYFLFLSRTLAVPVSWFPLQTWPLATNLVAAVGAGALAGAIAWTLVSAGISRWAAGAAGLMTVFVPILGLEAVNAAGSLYMPLLIWATLLASLPIKSTQSLILMTSVLLVTGLTIPSSIILLLPLFLSAYLFRPSTKRLLWGALALIAGFVVQVSTTVMTPNPRSMALSLDSAVAWFQGLASALWTLLPSGWELNPTGTIAASSSNTALGTVFPALLLLLLLGSAAVIWWGAKSDQPTLAGLGMLFVTGALLSGVPALVGYPNNRYFVIPVMALCVTSIVLVETVSTRWATPLAVGLAIVAVVVWIPRFPASDFRSGARPDWSSMLQEAQVACDSAPTEVRLTFSPDWPFDDAVFPGATQPLATCDQVRR